MPGYIKLYRQTLENPVVMKDADHLAVWVYLLLNATHKPVQHLFNGKKITLQPGQQTVGRKRIAVKLNISESKVQRVLKTLEIEQQIEQQTGNKNRLITVKNWAKYQDREQQIEQQLNNKRTTTEQQLNTEQEYKEDKEYKEIKNIYIGPLDKAIKDFKEHRQKMRKPMTDHAVELLLKKLDTLATTDEGKIALIETAIEKGWLSVYPTTTEVKPDQYTERI